MSVDTGGYVDGVAFPKPKRIENRALLDEIKTRRCVVCGRSPNHPTIPMTPSHIRTRGSGGPDTDWNTVAMCMLCHIEWGKLGAYRFCMKHPTFRSTLRRMGWIWEGYKLWHPRLAKGRCA